MRGHRIHRGAPRLQFSSCLTTLTLSRLPEPRAPWGIRRCHAAPSGHRTRGPQGPASQARGLGKPRCWSAPRAPGSGRGCSSHPDSPAGPAQTDRRRGGGAPAPPAELRPQAEPRPRPPQGAPRALAAATFEPRASSSGRQPFGLTDHQWGWRPLAERTPGPKASSSRSLAWTRGVAGAGIRVAAPPALGSPRRKGQCPEGTVNSPPFRGACVPWEGGSPLGAQGGGPSCCRRALTPGGAGGRWGASVHGGQLAAQGSSHPHLPHPEQLNTQ